MTGSGGAGIWVDDEGTAPRFSGNHVNGSAVGVLVTDGAGGELPLQRPARQHAGVLAPGQPGPAGAR